MTVLVEINGSPQSATTRNTSSDSPSRTRSFADLAVAGDDLIPQLETVVRRVRGARRIVVICGAGVSTAASIPDFRGTSGLFSGSRGHGVKDLFHVKSLSSPTLLPHHHALLNNLHERAASASPTTFHNLLARLDSDGQLLRCYTQNIDGLEARAGLHTGIPPQRVRAKRGVSKTRGVLSECDSSQLSSESADPSPSPAVPSPGPAALGDIGTNLSHAQSTHPPAPRCIPLHGLLSHLRCTLCSTSVSMQSHLPLPAEAIPCPQCDEQMMIRSALSERQRRSGTLRASVVLYGEEHPEGELIGTVVERDLRGTGRRGEKEGRADLLLVAGTSLAIPGVKRIVKEMSRALHTRPDSSMRDGKAPPVRTVFINNEPPFKPAEWDGVFDVWVRGDVQEFARLVVDEEYARAVPATPVSGKKNKSSTPKSNKAAKEKNPAKTTPKKDIPQNAGDVPPTPESITPTKKRGRKVVEEETPTKKRPRTALPLTPRPTPPRPRGFWVSGISGEDSASSYSHDASTFTRDTSPSPMPNREWDKPGSSADLDSDAEAEMTVETGRPKKRPALAKGRHRCDVVKSDDETSMDATGNSTPVLYASGPRKFSAKLWKVKHEDSV